MFGLWTLLIFLRLLCLGCPETLAGFQAPAPVTTPHLQQLIEEGRKVRQAGDFEKAERLFQLAADEAKRAGNASQQAGALLLVTGCQIHRFHYGAALNTAATARESALRASDNTILGALATNVSNIYVQLGDTASAARVAGEAVGYLKGSPRRDYFIRSLINYGEIQFGLGHYAQGNSLLSQAIEVARSSGAPQMEALASDHLGALLTVHGELPEAQSALMNAVNLYKAHQDSDGLAGSYEHLAELESRKGGPYLRSALNYIDLAFATKSSIFRTSLVYYPIHIRGQILRGLGEKEQALAEFRRAVTAADIWRQSALPGDTTNTQTVVQLESVYRDYAQLGAELSLERDDHALARESFEVLARNRAASLREQLTRSFSGKLLDSPEYFGLLHELETAQAAATLNHDPAQIEADREKLSSIRARLSDLENHIGLNQHNISQLSEIKSVHTSLKGIQARLSENEALLSFSLGERKSFLWAVTKENLRLYDLPRQEIIAGQADAFSRAVSDSSDARRAAGRALSLSLFANIAPSLKRKKNWLLTPDGVLLDKVPFSTLPATFEGTDKALIASHSLRMLPSALLLQNRRQAELNDRFIGVADPVYNLADSRRDRSSNQLVYKKTSSTTLARLVGSEREVQVSAEKCGLTQTKILTGKAASGAELRQQIQPSPAILHFAVHVVSPKDFPGEAALALSLTKNNLPELLTAESAATYHIPGSLVVLSGCASQQGEVLPGAGLIGLSRGWLLAGAAAVIVSAWPTPDDSGQFFSSFYGHFRQTHGSVGSRAAAALQQTQLDMQRGGGYRSEPKFWAAYSIISKE